MDNTYYDWAGNLLPARVHNPDFGRVELNGTYIRLVLDNITKPNNGWWFEIHGTRSDITQPDWDKVCYNANEAVQFYRMLKDGDAFAYRVLRMHRREGDGQRFFVIAEHRTPPRPVYVPPEHGWCDLNDLEQGLSILIKGGEDGSRAYLINYPEVERFCVLVHNYIEAEKERHSI
jgi:hypothetical protein